MSHTDNHDVDTLNNLITIMSTSNAENFLNICSKTDLSESNRFFIYILVVTHIDISTSINKHFNFEPNILEG